MTGASECRTHAQECRALAAKMNEAAPRRLLLEMASTWDALAGGREDQGERGADGGSRSNVPARPGNTTGLS